jgi:hypothetical protein
MEMCLNEIHICVLVRKQRNEKYILSLNLELVNVGGYDFPTHVMASFKKPLVDTELWRACLRSSQVFIWQSDSSLVS